MTVDVLIPAYRPGEKFARLLSALRRQQTILNTTQPRHP